MLEALCPPSRGGRRPARERRRPPDCAEVRSSLHLHAGPPRGSKGESHRYKGGIERLRDLDVTKAVPRSKHGRAQARDDVVVQEGTVGDSQSIVLPEIMADPSLLQDQDQWLGGHEP